MGFSENEDFEPPVIKKPILHTDRWEGEDEDEDVKVDKFIFSSFGYLFLLIAFA